MRRRLAPLVRWESALVVLLAATVVYGARVSPAFLHWDQIFYIGVNSGEVAIIALPLALIVITGEIDLSVASVLGLSGTVMGEVFMHGWPIELAIAAALLVGMICGAFNGLLIIRLGLPSIAVTIGTLTLYRGLAQVLLPNDTIEGFPAKLTTIGVTPMWAQIPWTVGFFLVLAAIFGVVLHATPLGRKIFAIGANSEAAFYAGVRVKRIKFWLFVLSGLLSAFAGILWGLRFSSVRYDSGTGLELNAVAIVLLGGISIFGGRGTIVGLVLSVAVLATLQDALTLDLVTAQVQSIVIGGLLILSVILPNSSTVYRLGRDRLRSRMARRHAAPLVTAGEPGSPA